MTPSNICSGFHTCGVYPFNPDAIDCGIDVEGCASHNEHSDDNDKDTSCGFDDSSNSDDRDEFSAETLARFQKRYDEGYDLYDDEYTRWLELNHPSDLPADRFLLESTPSTPSVVDSFTSVESSENARIFRKWYAQSMKCAFWFIILFCLHMHTLLYRNYIISSG